MNRKTFSGIGIIFVILLSFSAAYFYYKDSPRRTAKEYLKAARLRDMEKLKKLSYPTHWNEISNKGLADLAEWKFIDEKRISTRKKEYDLSQGSYKRDLKSAIDLYQVHSIEKVPSEYLRDHLKSYDVWRADSINMFKLFEENGKYYYEDATPRIEYSIEVAAAGKGGAGSGKKYILAVEKKSSGKGRWEVTEFKAAADLTGP